MSWRWLLLLPFVAWLAYVSVYTVDATEFVYVTQFGRKVAVHDGGNPDEAGLWLKLPWPVQSVLRIDRRLQLFDLPPTELPTRDVAGETTDKMLTLDAYVSWRVAGSDGADRFVRTLGSAEAAQRLLGARVVSELGSAVGEMELEDLVSVEAGRVDRRRDELRRRLLDSGKALLRENGIEVVDVRLRRTGYPVSVREDIFNRIRSERSRKAAEYTTEGERLASDIRSRAEAEVAKMKADADAQAARLISEAKAAADAIRNDAQRADPKFYELLRKMEDYQTILGDNKSTLLLSTHRELFDLLYNPPAVAPKEKK